MKSSAAFPQGRSPAATRKRVILIVDDTADTRELYSLYFESSGFGVLTAGDGEAALQVAGTHRPDVIVMDLAMPRLDGLTATRRLRQDPHIGRTPVILLTGYPHRAIEEGVLSAGADVFLTKPCLPEDLEATVRKLLEGRPVRRPPPADR